MHFKFQLTCSGSAEWINIRKHSIILTSDSEQRWSLPEEQTSFQSLDEMEAPVSHLSFPIPSSSNTAQKVCSCSHVLHRFWNNYQCYKALTAPADVCSCSPNSHAFQLGICSLVCSYFDDCKSEIKTRTMCSVWGCKKPTSGLL